MSTHIKVIHDDSPAESPRDWDNVGVMACWHRSYALGDVQPKCTPDEWLADNAPKGSIVLALYLYDHSGITMSVSNDSYPFTCEWDSGQVGVIVCTPDKIDHEWSGDRDKAESYLKGEVSVYDEYIMGNVWGYVIERDIDECDSCGHAPEREEIDSCWGFFGDALDDMKAQVDEEYHAALTEAWENRGG